VVVVDRRPLERNLVRFILQENGFEVAAEAATPAEALLAVERERPAVVVLHENAAWEQGQPTIPVLRSAVPETKLLVIAHAFGVVRVDLLRDADAVVEEGVGFKDLPFVIGKLAAGDATRHTSTAGGADGAKRQASPRSRPDRERWLDRFQGATAAAVVFLALVIAGAAAPPETLGARPTAALIQARHSLDDLESAASDPANDLIPQAIEVAADRAAAIDAGANVSELDADIRALMHDVLPSLPPEAANTLMLVFADVVGGTTPTPTPTESSPAPTATEPGPGSGKADEPSPEVAAPPPSPSDEPLPSATEEPSPGPDEEEPGPKNEVPSPKDEPSPTPTEEPSPTPTEEPSPTPTEEPSPTPTEEPPPRQTEQRSADETDPSPTASESEPPPSPSSSTSETDPPSPSASETDPASPSSMSPSETPSPTATGGLAAGTGDGGGAVAVLVVPSGVGVLAGVARRRARRRKRR
jgi:hypothetical protein